MPYKSDLTWDLLSQKLSSATRNTRQHMREGVAHYDDWEAFKEGKTIAQVATTLGRTTEEVTEMNAAFAALNSMRTDAVTNGHIAALKKFI